ncbi:MAG: RidA family protein [Gammaproteobacteria bacterium]|jgi:enamine deaminase RidA (YjgF/YER057c/UK114 family)|uniref:Enamine deaminase RidA, house cleaning of reactive enamine intermediates, YjgF/YER057c/UK114 family n=1 Tax=Marinomonas polaris DSM 16579 TaxID=1122206 RepID=A0A1M4V8M0_9GAMM|nr:MULTISPECIES: RidA family protein [Marinomonas]MBU1297282.1 RidA family protein [Gammaproteobacteria bacterium]MBU1465872.1 RidA family protein [Gammaproteobacteria bacterium]MBU2240363.1 RidA family protein [Gammaproteobacteria bacterium]MBU2317731.1 RidA family protein [Gammaproteobacteria bacterium]MBU2414498.1 RidA family protein [Gammaproteobacteria bacterium]|tara:strand:+ start:16653 stop:17045 length:393 start_codon:yes stop_codon:yes gene_type:complete
MTTRKAIVPKGMEFVRDEIGYAPGVLVGSTLYIAGQIGRNSERQLVEDKRQQFIQCFENMKAVLNTAKMSFNDVVEVTSYHTDMRDLPLYMEVRNLYFGDCLPAWTAIGAASLCGIPGYFLEVKAIAVKG